ncbi:MAG: HU family DNA-binding protein [Actinobacteria bacterium]|nr:HU family DNA-binding protein [Actinomycetota bacterium]MCG2803241.1 HU family DNA-binding protein [Cellulomonas sp.]
MVGKAQIVDKVAAAGGTRAQAALAVDAVLEAVTAELVAGERVTLTGFGTFEPVARPARTVRNPRTGGSVEVPASVAARFRPGAGLRAALAGVGAAAAVVVPSTPGTTAVRPAAKSAAAPAVKPARTAATAATGKAAAKAGPKAGAEPAVKASGKSGAKEEKAKAKASGKGSPKAKKKKR